jgi:hypothetical protein
MNLRRFCYFGSAFLFGLTALSWSQGKYLLAILFSFGALLGMVGSLLFAILDAIERESDTSIKNGHG